MPCLYPVEVKVPDAGVYLTGFRYAEVPCGRCADCRIVISRSWAMRLMHEGQMHEYSSFVTLTFDNDSCPRSLSVRDVQLFHKRLRKLVPRYRHFTCGEYGGGYGRPHYHAILFGLRFPDRFLWKLSKRNQPLYRSPTLEKAWTFGFSSIGDVTPAAAQYVAQYTTKKLGGDRRAEYEGRKPEFAVSSRRPYGIGGSWIDQFASSVFPRDFVVVAGGKRAKVPRYYFERQPEAVQALVKQERQEAALAARSALHEKLFHEDPREYHRRVMQYHAEKAARRAALEHKTKTTNLERDYEHAAARLRSTR